jgi:MFS family permease
MFTIQEHLGNASSAGLANSISLVGGLVGGFLFGKVSGKLNNLMLPFGYVLIAIGFLITYSSTSLIMACIGAFIAGVSISFFMPQAVLSTTREVSPEYITMGLAIVSTFGSLGAFISPLVYTTTATAVMGNDSAKSRFLFVGIVALLLAVVMSVIVTVRKKKLAA